jgi:fatty-acyl-CoA synthase
MAHAAGVFALAGVLRGACVRLEDRFDCELFRSRVDADDVTWTFVVPTMISRLVAYAEEHDWRPRLRTMQYGAAPISGDLLGRAMDRFGPVLQQLYGQTECPMYATQLTKADHLAALKRPELLGSAGRAVTMCDLTVRHDDGREAAAGDPGEICLWSPYIMAGYWNNPEAYAERFYGKWLRTGDVGYLDKDDYLFLTDRRNDMIVSGGMNVYSIEVENVLHLVDGVLSAAVVGVPHPDWGEAVRAVIVPRRQAASEEEEQTLRRLIDAQCRERLARYKVPKDIDFVTELPLTRYGKVDKRALRSRYWPAPEAGIN